jgi:phytoene dehydrogenase-like protein
MTAVARKFTYTTALDLVSAEMFVEKLQRSVRHPVHDVEGGWQVLVDGLRYASEASDARTVIGAHVESVEVSGDRAGACACATGASWRTPTSSSRPDHGTPRSWWTRRIIRCCVGSWTVSSRCP